MKIAVTYENGEVFQHFGHTERFKVYEVENGQVTSAAVIDSAGSGHGALAGLLADRAIDVLICGGIGAGAQAALAEQGIALCAGAQGSADAAVEAYLRGELVNTGANCDHHHEDGHSCGEVVERYTETIPATGEPDTPDEPTGPTDPADPGTPSGDNICKWDNVDHGSSFWGRLIKFFHSVLYFFARLFGRR